MKIRSITLRGDVPFRGSVIPEDLLRKTAENLPENISVTRDFGGEVIGKVVETTIQDGKIVMDVQIQDPAMMKKTHLYFGNHVARRVAIMKAKSV